MSRSGQLEWDCRKVVCHLSNYFNIVNCLLCTHTLLLSPYSYTSFHPELCSMLRPYANLQWITFTACITLTPNVFLSCLNLTVVIRCQQYVFKINRKHNIRVIFMSTWLIVGKDTLVSDNKHLLVKTKRLHIAVLWHPPLEDIGCHHI